MNNPLVIVFLIDALGWKIVERFGFCNSLSLSPTPLDTVLGYSSAAIPSLLTGRRPDEHGVWSMWKLARDRKSPFAYLRYLPRLPHALEWRLRNVVRRIAARQGRIDGYYELYDIPLHLLSRFDVAGYGDPYRPGGLRCESVFDHIEASGVRYRSWDYRSTEPDNMEALLGEIESDAGFLFLYTAELDALMHAVGVFHPEVQKKLEQYEVFVASVLDRAAKAGRETRLYILSDHGMTDVDRTFDVWGMLDGEGFRLGTDYLAFFDSTMARFWLRGNTRDEIVAALAGSDAGVVLTDGDLERFGCRFGGGEYGDIIFLANPGTLFLPTFMGRTGVAAMHGYDPGDGFSAGCFLTNDGTADPPRSILEFKPFLESRLGEVRR
jgi:hypothetical protein